MSTGVALYFAWLQFSLSIKLLAQYSTATPSLFSPWGSLLDKLWSCNSLAPCPDTGSSKRKQKLELLNKYEAQKQKFSGVHWKWFSFLFSIIEVNTSMHKEIFNIVNMKTDFLWICNYVHPLFLDLSISSSKKDLSPHILAIYSEAVLSAMYKEAVHDLKPQALIRETQTPGTPGKEENLDFFKNLKFHFCAIMLFMHPTASAFQNQTKTVSKFM